MKTDMQFREAAFEIRGEGDEQAIRMSVSSEAPVLTYAFYDGMVQRVYEILDHSPSSIDMSRCRDGLVILDTHGGDQIGLMAVDVSDRKMGGPVEFCTGARAQEIKQDAVRKLRRNTSVGYRVDPDSYRIEGTQDGIPVVRATSWMPYEASFVPVPADPGVGVGRAEKTTIEKENQPVANATKEKQMDPKEMAKLYARAAKFGIDAEKVSEIIEAGGARAELDAMIVDKQSADVEKARKDAEAARQEVEVISKRKPETATPVANPSVIVTPQESKEIEKRYSIVNVVRHMVASANGERSGVDIGFEREVSEEFARRSGKIPRGIFIPHNVSIRADPFIKTGNGSNFVATNLLSGQLIDALRSKMVLANAGVTMLTGLVGDIAIPKGGTISGSWVDGENNAVNDAKPTVTQVTGTPKTASAWCEASRRLYTQSSIDIESFIQNELMNTIARLIEVAAFAGTNANGQPKGLKSQTGVNNPSVTANAATRQELIKFLTDILADNADFPNKSWIMRPDGAGLLRGLPDGILENQAETENVSTYGMGPLLKDSGQLLGYPVYETNNVPAHHAFFGAWSQLIIGMWGGLDLTVDPYSNSTTGAVRIVTHQDVDVMVRNGEAFSYTAALTA